MRIYLIRHGETAWNRESRIQGREDVPLDGEGLAQARALAEAFRDAPLAAVLTSPLMRARRTAELIASAAGTQVYVEPDLTERDFGSVSGQVVDIFNPEKYAADLEPLDDVAARALAVLRRRAGELTGDFAAVSHGGTINACLRALSAGAVGSGKTRLLNAGVSVLEAENGQLRLLAWNLPAAEAAARGKQDGQSPLPGEGL